ncbi:MAG TPA: hypothetical protein VJ508_06495 [Saprospiraceae bacterium]|nr:hypothetical protein [Saprospiraceae bacterium]
MLTGKNRHNIFLLLLLIASVIACKSPIAYKNLRKIELDTTHIDAHGLNYGEAPVDYEFCIPALATSEKRILSIEPKTRILKLSKGRVGCSDRQWLCIVTTHDDQWRKKLYSIASLSYVNRIIATYYE